MTDWRETLRRWGLISEPTHGLDSFDVPPPVPYVAKPGESDPDNFDG